MEGLSALAETALPEKRFTFVENAAAAIAVCSLQRLWRARHHLAHSGVDGSLTSLLTGSGPHQRYSLRSAGGSSGSVAEGSVGGDGVSRTANLDRLLASCCCNEVLRHFVENPAPLQEPLSGTFPCACLWLDISGFTPLAEALSSQDKRGGADQLASIINAYFNQLIGRILEHGGDVLKFCGDALLCMFRDVRGGAQQQMAVLAASRCALQIQKELGTFDASSDHDEDGRALHQLRIKASAESAVGRCAGAGASGSSGPALSRETWGARASLLRRRSECPRDRRSEARLRRCDSRFASRRALQVTIGVDNPNSKSNPPTVLGR